MTPIRPLFKKISDEISKKILIQIRGDVCASNSYKATHPKFDGHTPRNFESLVKILEFKKRGEECAMDAYKATH